jgi:FKBP-type peptidyl-prolyl cis-trans isomerase
MPGIATASAAGMFAHAPDRLLLTVLGIMGLAGLVGCQGASTPDASTRTAPRTQEFARKTERIREEMSSRSQARPFPAEAARPPNDAIRHSASLTSKVLAHGTGDRRPSRGDSVVFTYTGWTQAGRQLGTTAGSSQPRPSRVEDLTAAWRDAIQLMTAGELRRLWMADEKHGTLVFDVELRSITPRESRPTADIAVPADAHRSASGLAWSILSAGTGSEHPDDNSIVRFRYTAWRADGHHSSGTVGDELQRAVVHELPAGLAEALKSMTRGSRWRLWIPSALAKVAGAPDAQVDMVFEVELVDFVSIPLPADATAAAQSARRTSSGLIHARIRSGKGDRRPTLEDTVEIAYAVWTEAGQLYDASASHGAPVEVRVDAALPGWTEALQLMRVGEKRRLWIPQHLAYRGQAGTPQGMVVCDLELVSFKAPSVTQATR